MKVSQRPAPVHAAVVLFDSTRPTAAAPASFARGVHMAAARLAVARQEADRAYLDALTAERDTWLDGAHDRLVAWKGRRMPYTASDRLWAAQNLDAAPMPVMSGGAPESETIGPWHQLDADGEWVEVPPVEVPDQDELDREMAAMFCPPPVITPGPTDPAPISGGAPHPCECWEMLAAEAERDAEWDHYAALAAAADCQERGLEWSPDASGAFIGHDA